MNEKDLRPAFLERTTADLSRSLNEVQWWKKQVACGLVKPEHAEAYIRIEQRIIETKRHILGFPKRPC